MVSRAVQTALARLWTDRCTIYGQNAVTVLGSHLTDFQPVVLAEDVPCKLSFESLTVTRWGSPSSCSWPWTSRSQRAVKSS